MIPNPSIEVQTSAVDRPSVPAWFAEVVIVSQHLTTKGLLEAFAHHVQLVRGRFGSYEPIDFLGHHPDLWTLQSGSSQRLEKGLFIDKRADIL